MLFVLSTPTEPTDGGIPLLNCRGSPGWRRRRGSQSDEDDGKHRGHGGERASIGEALPRSRLIKKALRAIIEVPVPPWTRVSRLNQEVGDLGHHHMPDGNSPPLSRQQ